MPLLTNPGRALLWGAPRPFLPDQLSNLALWLKAYLGTFQNSALSTAAAADGDPVGGWQDQSGQGKHLVQGTSSKKPTLKLAIQNGLPILRNDAVDDFLSVASISTFPAKRGSLFLAGNFTHGGTLGARVLIGTDPGAAISWQLGLYTGGVSWYDGSTTQQIHTDTTAAFKVITVRRTGDTTLQCWVNGVAGTPITIANNQPSASAPLALFATTAGAVGTNAADVGEVLLVGADVGSSQQAAAEAYLRSAARWNL